jgi:hypothetical protein
MEFRLFSVDQRQRHRFLSGLKHIAAALLLLCNALLTYSFGQDSVVHKSTSIRLNSSPVIYKSKPVFKLGDDLNSLQVRLDTLTTKNFQYRGLSRRDINIGNVGSTSYSLVFNPAKSTSNDYTRLAYQSDHQLMNWKTEKPITYAEYQTGSAQEQLFSVFHTQSFRNRNNLLLGMDKINSKGFYQNQAINNTHFYSRFVGVNKTAKYQYTIGYAYHKQMHQLNGGLLRDEDFTDNQLDFSNKALLNVSLGRARQTLSYHKASFSQVYKLTIDSAKHNFEIFNDWSFLNQSRLYYDTLLSTQYYDYFTINDNVTRDSLSYTQYASRLGMKYMNNATSPIYILASTSLYPSINRFTNLGTDTTVFDLEAEGKLNIIYESISASIRGSYLLNDRYANNDYSVQGEITYRKFKGVQLKAEWIAQRDRPSLDLLRYNANAVVWSNEFSKTELYSGTIRMSYNKKWFSLIDDHTNFQVEALIRYSDIKNPIFFNLFREPQQIDGFAQIIQTGVSIDWSSKKWHIKNESFYQYTGGYQVLPLPKWFSHMLVEYGFKAFKQKMELTLGADVQYYSAFQAPKYDPVTNQFYISGTQELGNYPFVDVFLKARIQRVKIAFISSHVNQGLLGTNYFFLPHYPANDRMLKIALSWLFLN